MSIWWIHLCIEHILLIYANGKSKQKLVNLQCTLINFYLFSLVIWIQDETENICLLIFYSIHKRTVDEINGNAKNNSLLSQVLKTAPASVIRAK